MKEALSFWTWRNIIAKLHRRGLLGKSIINDAPVKEWDYKPTPKRSAQQ